MRIAIGELKGASVGRCVDILTAAGMPADSRRASRHAGPVAVWRLTDAAAARRYLAMHRAAG